MQNRWLKWQAAAIAASGIVTLGALAAATGQEPKAIAIAPMFVGGTTTSTTPAPSPPTGLAAPTMKAQRPRGF
jgi:hypothetical protein